MKSNESNSRKSITITPNQLKKWMQGEKNPYILDVRPKEETNEWSIPESEPLDIYRELQSGRSTTLESTEFSSDRPVVTVCGAGRTSLTAAEQLRERGLEAYSLDGGMKAWNFAWDVAEFAPEEELTILQVRRLAKGCLSYMIGSKGEALVIDASLDPEVYLQLAKKRSWSIRYVADTHLHADFVSRSRELAKTAGADYLLSRKAETRFPFKPLKNGEQFDFGDVKVTALHHPGHTPESMSFLIKGHAVFTGDTIFTDGLGRPDLKADREEALQKAERLYESLRELLSLQDSTRVFPAHVTHSVRLAAPAIRSTIGKLSESIDLLDLSKEDFLREIVQRIPSPPSNYRVISRINRSGNRNGHRLEELETGANRCAVHS